ncbi:MAG: transcriptional regulator [Pirellulaceae bacterium]|nr:transcriptional regulator [Pirellulaceae bacterium]
MTSPRPNDDGVHEYSGLDRVFHEKARLAIMTSLASQTDGLSFADLKRLCKLSDGNLNRHLEVLQEVGAVVLDRSGAGRGSRTTVCITRAGRKEFQNYLAELERVLKTAVRALEKSSAPKPKQNRVGLSDA